MTRGQGTDGGTDDGEAPASVDLGRFEFESGDELPLTVAYETYGEYRGDNAVLVCHALTGSHHVTRRPGESGNGPAGIGGQADSWWDPVVGPGRPVDTDQYFVICANVPGSCYGTTGPTSTDPETGEPYGSSFPPVTVGDWTRAQARLLEALGVDRLRAVVGGSVGGTNVLEWARRYPDRIDRIVPIATGPRLGPQLLALHATARRAIVGDPNWQGGDYYGEGPDPDHGLAQARRIGHVTYLSATSMERRFGRRAVGGDGSTGDGSTGDDSTGDGESVEPVRPGNPSWAPDPGADRTHEAFPYREVASYLDYNAGSFTDRFDANSYLRLLRAMDEYDLSAGDGSDRDALAGFDGEALLVSFTGDWHFPLERSRELAESLRAAGVETTHEVIDSEYGHDAFLVEPGTYARQLARFLDGRDPTATPAGRAPVHASLFR